MLQPKTLFYGPIARIYPRGKVDQEVFLRHYRQHRALQEAF